MLFGICSSFKIDVSGSSGQEEFHTGCCFEFGFPSRVMYLDLLGKRSSGSWTTALSLLAKMESKGLGLFMLAARNEAQSQEPAL